MHMNALTILSFLFTVTGKAATIDPQPLSGDHISTNCGSTSLRGREWRGDFHPILASSITSQLDPGQKIIRFHFNPASGGFPRFDDFFTVGAGPFALIANFSASIAADDVIITVSTSAYAFVNGIEIVSVFRPSKYAYAFVNGIEIISVPSSVNYCHVGVQVVGCKSVIYIDNNTSLEWGSGDDIIGIFTEKLKGNSVNYMSLRISVDVGFRYLVRIHFCEVGLKTVEAGHQMVVSTTGDILRGGNQSFLLYKNSMVIVEGHKREGKRDIFISLQTDHVFFDRHGPLEGFKLSKHDYNLAGPNPLLPKRGSPLQPIQILLSLPGRRNALGTVVFAAVFLVNIIVYMLQQTSVSYFTEEEENKPSTRAKRPCRRFSLAEILSATDNFYDAFVIGQGGFGKVYKGLIDNGRETVAIKRLKPDSRQGKHQFWTEVKTLSELQHVNLVFLIGYCNEQSEMILVYEYMACGTLADHLYKLDRENSAYHPLSWKQRLQICIGAGRGLDYLHRGLENEIIHCDVKASNILLDVKFVAKVSDFGLAEINSGSKSQNEAITNLKGTFGYIDPHYFRTNRLTIESDTYSFGVVLLEVLCGRPAVERWAEEDKRSLTMWARDNIIKGQVYHIVDPSLREEISPYSLKTFVRIAGKCLLDEPKKRPSIAHVVMKLQLALKRQNHKKFLVLKDRDWFANIFPLADKSQKENTNSLVTNERTNVGVSNALPGDDRTILSVSTSSVQNASFLLREQIISNMISPGKKDKRKPLMHKLSRKLWPRDALWKTRSSLLKKRGVVSHAQSASIQRWSSYASRGSITASGKSRFSAARGSDQANPNRGGGQILAQLNLRNFSFLQLRAATRNFRNDRVLGRGAFGKVYKGWLGESGKAGIGSIIAVKMTNSESGHGFREWQTEVNILGRLSHPNVVKLLGFCWEGKALLLVYGYMQKGSLDNLLFQRSSSVEPLPWDIRLKIMIGAARGLSFLHSLDIKVIHRDIKTANILLDESYNAKISDFGLAKLGPSADHYHVSTGHLAGTFGYIDPIYGQTGELHVTSDVYSFGVVLLEMLTGLRVCDDRRPYKQQNLVEWTKPHLSAEKKLNDIIDSRLEGRYPTESAIKFAELARNCVEYDPRKRPSMEEVVERLEKMDAAVEKPIQQHL